jgi:hypothetical protein
VTTGKNSASPNGASPAIFERSRVENQQQTGRKGGYAHIGAARFPMTRHGVSPWPSGFIRAKNAETTNAGRASSRCRENQFAASEWRRHSGRQPLIFNDACR